MKNKAYGVARSNYAWVVLGVALGVSTSACSGDDSSDREITAPELPTTPTLIVDTFERMTAGTEACNKGNTGVCPAWYPYDDGSLTVPDGGFGAAGPPPALEVVELTALDTPLVTFDPNKPSKTAMHIHGGPYTGTYGAGVSHSFVDKGTMSVTDYSGFVFWGRRGVGGEATMHISVTTLDDTAKAQLPPDVMPICHDPATPGKSDGCSDGFGIDLVLHEQWFPYVVYFSDLKQQGYGYKPAGGFDKVNATGFNIGNKQGYPFDEYIDDIALFK